MRELTKKLTSITAQLKHTTQTLHASEEKYRRVLDIHNGKKNGTAAACTVPNAAEQSEERQR